MPSSLIQPSNYSRGFGFNLPNANTAAIERAMTTTAPAPPTTPTVAKKKLVVDIDVKYPVITRGSTQVISIIVSSDGAKIGAADVSALVTYASGSTQKSFQGITDSSGIFTFSWMIGGNSTLGTFSVHVSVSKEGYESGSASTTFKVVSKSGY